VRFLYLYLMKCGCLDGRAGLDDGVLAAVKDHVAWLKVIKPR